LTLKPQPMFVVFPRKADLSQEDAVFYSGKPNLLVLLVYDAWMAVEQHWFVISILMLAGQETTE
jgi:hypothetical protein